MGIDAGLLTLLGAVVSGIGTVVSAGAQASAYEAQAQQAENNAIIAERNAEDARSRGVAAEQEQQMKTRALIGRQKNVLSERNVSLNSGTAIDLIGDTAMFGKMDALTIRSNFEREAIAYQTQQYNFSADAENARSAASATTFGAGVSLFSTALGAVGQYQKYTDPNTMRFN